MKTKVCIILTAIFIMFCLETFAQENKAAKLLSPGDINQVVLEEIARILNTKSKELAVNKTFWEQPQKADALDIVETIMSIEERLEIEISDDAIDKACGAKGVEDIAQKLTISTFQRIVRESYSKMHK